MTIVNSLKAVQNYVNSPTPTDCELTELAHAVAEIGRAQRKHNLAAKELTSQTREAVFKKLIAQDTPISRIIARDMIRRDVLPSKWGVSQLKDTAGAHPEMKEYVTELKERLEKDVNALDGEEVLCLQSNRFTRRVLKQEQKAKWATLRHPELKEKAQQAAQTPQHIAKRRELEARLAQAQGNRKADIRARIKAAKVLPRHGRIGPVSNAVRRDTNAASPDSSTGVLVLRDPSRKSSAGQMCNTDAVAAHGVVNQVQQQAIDRQFKLLQRAPSSRIPEIERFTNATEALTRLVRLSAGRDEPLFKNIPDLLHRIFTEPAHDASAEDGVGQLFETIREGLRGDGRRLSPTAQKLLVWMAIVSDPKCLMIDDPARVTMRQAGDGTFEVKRSTPDGAQRWSPAGDGKLDLEYTKNLIAHWFTNPADVRFDDGMFNKDGAIKNIRLNGPLYKCADGVVELSGNLSLTLGRNRLQALERTDSVKFGHLADLHQLVRTGRPQTTLQLDINLDRLPTKPINVAHLTEIIWGDMQGDIARELYALHATGVIKIVGDNEMSAQEAWRDICEAIRSGTHSMLAPYLEKYVTRGDCADGRTFVTLGATLEGHVGNSLVDLQIHHFLREKLSLAIPELRSGYSDYLHLYVLNNRRRLDYAAEKLYLPFDGPVSDLSDGARSPDANSSGAGLYALQGEYVSFRKMSDDLYSRDYFEATKGRKDLREYLRSHYRNLEFFHIAEDRFTVHANDRFSQKDFQKLEQQAIADGVKISSRTCLSERTHAVNQWLREKLCILGIGENLQGEKVDEMMSSEEARRRYFRLMFQQ